MNGCMHTRSDVARLYLPRKEGGRGLISIEECVRKESNSLYSYFRENAEWMLQAALKEVLVEEENLHDYQKRKQEKKSRTGKKKPCMESLYDKLQM